MISKGDDSTSKFYVDPASGYVRSMVNFALDANKYYNFEVKASDNQGLPGSNSAITNVFVSQTEIRFYSKF